MKVLCVDKLAPRSDNVQGSPSGITVGNVYVVAEILDGHRGPQYSIINDDMKIARYSQSRFEVIVGGGIVNDIRGQFNSLTTPMRSRIKELEKQIAEMQKSNNVAVASKGESK